ncbi:hypothetical protein SAMN02745134_03064 [Clostridium acidisoli DSM 12555]|jgi:hypothetical protein|uniref:Uncharacterized protein n=1 Tax=Clostridium acidisoli DSM 12555 TaxID=1121291 RepID=A0A1W1XUC2_9CLOT|nr:hypothetical protein [Clostridium acidisoli]SMC27141.1 hypothetical protein SAMN02745134_03064 [Clostridium acidisoli DSM 12555]
MDKTSIELATKEIDEALDTVNSMENDLGKNSLSESNIKEQFIFLSKKVKELENILIEEGIL